MQKDFYLVLRVSRSATAEEIKLAYREMALIHHPDRNPGNGAAAKKFMLVKEAYEILSNPHERLLHDQELKFQEGKAWAPKSSHPAARPPAKAPDVPPQDYHPDKPRKGLTERQIFSRVIIGIGAALAARGFLGVYVAPQSALLERWLSLSGGSNEAFLLMLAGIALALFGLGR
jgi:curved DNA-binding protein CbpA